MIEFVSFFKYISPFNVLGRLKEGCKPTDAFSSPTAKNWHWFKEINLFVKYFLFMLSVDLLVVFICKCGKVRVSRCPNSSSSWSFEYKSIFTKTIPGFKFCNLIIIVIFFFNYIIKKVRTWYCNRPFYEAFMEVKVGYKIFINWVKFLCPTFFL